MALNRLASRGLRASPLTSRSTAALRCMSSHAETDDYIVFPRERPGLDYGLNWSLNRNGVTPLGDAYRWTKAADASKFGAQAEKVTKGDAAPEAKDEATEGELSFEAFDAALAGVKEMLTTESTLFVAEGESPESRIPTRVISDSPTIAATAITNILRRMPKDPVAQVLPVTCFVSDKGAPFAGFIVESGDGAVYAEEDTVASVVLTGSEYSSGKLSSTIERAAKALSE